MKKKFEIIISILIAASALYFYAANYITDQRSFFTFLSFIYIFMANVALFIAVFANLIVVRSILLPLAPSAMKERANANKKLILIAFSLAGLIVMFACGGFDVEGGFYYNNTIIAIVLAIMIPVVQQTLKHVPQDVKDSGSKVRLWSFVVTNNLFCFAFFASSAGIIYKVNRHLFRSSSLTMSIAADLLLLIFTIILWQSLVKRKRARTALSIIAIIIVAASSLTLYRLKSYKYISTSSEEQLKALPYVAWVPSGADKDKSGVTLFNKEKAAPGLNVYFGSASDKVRLMDMSGEYLHTWRLAEGRNVKYANVSENGDIILLEIEADFKSWRGRSTVRMDYDSNILWSRTMRSHHEIFIAENDDIYVLTRADEVATLYGIPLPIVNDYIEIMSPDGELKRRINLFEALKDEIPFDKALSIYYAISKRAKYLANVDKLMDKVVTDAKATDILHNNTITIVDKDIDGVCEKGDLIISARELDLVAIMDIDTEEIKWSWGPGELERQHHPTMLENGNILIYDNGSFRKWSRIVEVDPRTDDIVWEYKADPVEDFFSEVRGSAQRLQNGNTLITESNSGRVFEVTIEGEKVWEFFNPDVKDDKRRAMFRMLRITDIENYDSKIKELVR